MKKKNYLERARDSRFNEAKQKVFMLTQTRQRCRYAASIIKEGLQEMIQF